MRGGGEIWSRQPTRQVVGCSKRVFAGFDRTEQFDHFFPRLVEIDALLLENLGPHALALADEAEQDVLGADVVVAELQRLAQRMFQCGLGRGGKRDVPPWRLGTLPDQFDNRIADRSEFNPQDLESPGRDPVTLMQQTEE